MRKYHTYILEIMQSKINRKFFEGRESNFVAPATQKCNKLYCVIDEKGIIHYIGQTVRSLSARMGTGFNPKGGTGYHGYKWRHTDGNYKLLVWFMEDEDHIETIEAEIVYLIRNKTGNWPASQNEIHFYPSDERQRELAAVLYGNIVNECIV